MTTKKRWKMKKLVIAIIVILSVVSQFALASQVANNQPRCTANVKLAQAAPALDTEKTQQYISNKLQTKIQNDFEKQLENNFNLAL